MKKYTMNDFIAGKLSVRVNENNMMEFLKMCEAKGLRWMSGYKATERNYPAETVEYYNDGVFCGLSFTRHDQLNHLTGRTIVDFSQIINPSRYQIIIETDGNSTTAKMIVNGKEVKQATAKRNPADKANWRTGAQTAFDRLWEKQEKPEKHAEKDGFKVGDRVVCVDDSAWAFVDLKGKSGRVVCIENGTLSIGVEFDEVDGLHNCDGKAISGHGWWLTPKTLRHESHTKQTVREVKRQAKAGEYIKLTEKSYSFDKVGLILRVDKVNGCALVLQKNHPTSNTNSHPEFPWAYSKYGYVVLEGYKP